MLYLHYKPNRLRLSYLLAIICGINLCLIQAVAAQNGQPESNRSGLILVDSDSRAFPLVTLLVDVNGVQDLPPQGLTTDDFQITEDGRPVAAQDIYLEVDQSSGVDFILLLDRSTEPVNWPAIQDMLRTISGSLQPQDRLAVFTYDEQVNLLFGLQNNTAAIQSALDSISPGGSFSALNVALQDGLRLAQSVASQRKVVIVIGDSPDNITVSPSFADTLNTVQQSDIPVYLFGYGEKVQAFPDLQSLSTVSGGRAIISATSAEITSQLQTQLAQLRRLYRLQFRSQIGADGREHVVDVSLPQFGASLTSPGTVQARPAEVSVSIPNVRDGQRVAGDINLTAQATTPAPIAKVNYLLDGVELLASVDDIGYSIIWDSTSVEPGTHQIEVTVIDMAGNQGTTSLSFEVIPPLTVSVLPPQPGSGDVLSVDGDIRLAAEIGAQNPVSRVEFFVDRVLAGTVNEAPYELTVPAIEFEPGLHTVTIRASDATGHEVVETAEFRLESAAADGVAGASDTNEAAMSFLGAAVSTVGRWLLILFYLLLGVAAAVAAYFAGRWLLQPKAIEPLAVCRFVIANMGNAASHYLMRAEEPTGILTMTLQLNGSPLPSPLATRIENRVQSADAIGSTVHGANGVGHRNAALNGATAGVTQGRVGGPGVSVPKIPSVKPEAVDLEGAGDTVQEAMAISKAIADILNTVAYFLPASLGRPVRSLARTIRRGQMMARRFQRAQKQVDKLKSVSAGTKTAAGASKIASSVQDVATSDATRAAAHRTKDDVGRMAQNAFGSSVANVYHGAQQITATAQAEKTRAANGFRSTLNRPANHPVGETTTQSLHLESSTFDGITTVDAQILHAEGWVETPYVLPGQSMTVEVVVTVGKKIPKSRQVPFRILSRSVDDEDAITVIEDASIQVPGTSWLNRQLSSLPLPGIARFATLFIIVMHFPALRG